MDNTHYHAKGNKTPFKKYLSVALGEVVQWEPSTKTVFIGGKIELKPNQLSSVLAEVQSIYENTGAKFEGDITIILRRQRH
ncbi:hypothetical protein QNH46_13975 [Paenibacillus woosongensis]|uniref:Copper amine oxidase-like N-terminal domain-containing protein n=1 Tax=Paenibacillus woosongensis TaxID=307580 RepID=A0AA95KUC9_9BACL|nr:hypothetical protein [Paenibacillus woosongensis]WHX47275.1 hypothetical protein QNH46_13975 [Paenibacillus woosongensis]